MLISNKNFVVKIILIFTVFNCAVQGPASGGPIDKTGPKLVSIDPINGSLGIASDQKVILIFNELLDPISIPASIQIKNQEDYELKIKGRKVIIFPREKWSMGELLRIDISRRVRDYQKNLMNSPIQLTYSFNRNIPDGIIKGTFFGIHKNKLVEVGLYKWPIEDSLILIQKVEADEKGSFIFNAINYGKYTLVAIEGILNDVKNQINKKRYSVSTSNFLNVNNNNVKVMNLVMSDPIERMRITSIDMESQYSSIITMDNNNKEIYVIDSSLSVGDSVFVNLSKSNRVESYQIPEYSFILPIITDTLSPYLKTSFYDEDKYILKFSEPVIISKNAFLYNADSVSMPLLFNYESPVSISIHNLTNSINEIKIIGSEISDWSQNIFLDSIKILSTIRINNEEKNIIGGNVFGNVIYDGDYPIKVEAKNINSKDTYISTTTNDKFEIINLQPGLYTLWAFEGINHMNRDIYHSGTLEPFHRSAKFSFYSDTIDVRARWDIENININFDN
tara:strand:+ start:382 stop:1899 length:1518 start_codon:yes stop_codon:yes gene_type:complete